MNEENRITDHPPAHQFEHAEPTVLHHHQEEDLTLLARGLKSAMEKGPAFWGIGLALLFSVVGGAAYLGSRSGGPTASSQAWTDLTQAKDAPDLVRIAESHQGTPAERWGLLQAGLRYYNQGFADLPNNRDAALPVLKKALDLFTQLARDTPKDDVVARLAALGMGRTLEARNDLPGAIEQYKKVGATWPNTVEADQALELLTRLDRPDAVDFYKQLYAYTKQGPLGLPSEPSNGGFGSLPGLPGIGGSFPAMPANHPPLDGPMIPATGLTAPLTGGLPEAGVNTSDVSKGAPATKDELPNPLEELAPKTEAPKDLPKL